MTSRDASSSTGAPVTSATFHAFGARVVRLTMPDLHPCDRPPHGLHVSTGCPPSVLSGETGPDAVEAPAAEVVVESVSAAMSFAPNAVGPDLGADLLLDDEARPGVESMRAGLLQAGPLAIAGVLANGASVVLTVALARLLTPHSYGVLNQLTGLYLILSMPGSAVVVAVVRRVTMMHEDGTGHLVRRWAGRVHRQGTMLVLVWAVVVFLEPPSPWPSCSTRPAGSGSPPSWPRRPSSSSSPSTAACSRPTGPTGRWPPTCWSRSACAWSPCSCWWRPATAPPGRPSASSSARCSPPGTRASRRCGPGRAAASRAPGPPGWVAAVRPDPVLLDHRRARRTVALDLVVASVSLSMVAVLQNVDVLVMGRDNPSHSGAYAAVSVTSKAIVFGAVVLGGYLLPEAAIRWRQGGHALRQLAVVLVLLGIPSVLLLGVALLAPEQLLQLVFHHEYTSTSDALAPLVVAMILLSVSVILTMYLLAVGRRWVAGVLVGGAAALTVAVLAVHGAPRATALVDLGVQAVVLAVIVTGFVVVHRIRLGESRQG